jgi:hypothetical protein
MQLEKVIERVVCEHNMRIIDCFECLMDNAHLGLNGEEEYLAVKEIVRKNGKGGDKV